ncbi:MAG: hypothetical protein ISR58_05095 [Anaerolineales bacterium]|nr:hypothetical protein [Chloroflexota bacterium]MBL6980549.1 hypothetical protein [Anaerolineales bacterium]
MLSKTVFSSEFFQTAGLPDWVWVVIIFLIILLVFLAAYWNSKKSGDDVVVHAAEDVLVEHDDLSKIEGIGPKIASVFNAAGITSFAQLAGFDVEKMQQILDDAGIRLGNPSTWAEQAKLAAEGDWGALQKLQDELQGGRRE